MHEIDYKIFGDDMQFVEVELDPNEATVAEAGGMMYMDDGIEMETIFGDGSQQQQAGFLGALMGAGKRLLTGESLFMTVFHNRSSQKRTVAFGAPYPGKIIADPSRRDRRRADRAEGLVPGGGEGRRASASPFSASSASGCSAAKASSCSACRATAGRSSTPAARFRSGRWRPARSIRVDTGCIVAFQPSVNYDIQFVGKIKSALFGGEGLFFATLQGPGTHLAAVAAAQPAGQPDHRRRAGTRRAAAARKARFSAGLGTCWTATTADTYPVWLPALAGRQWLSPIYGSPHAAFRLKPEATLFPGSKVDEQRHQPIEVLFARRQPDGRAQGAYCPLAKAVAEAANRERPLQAGPGPRRVDAEGVLGRTGIAEAAAPNRNAALARGPLHELVIDDACRLPRRLKAIVPPRAVRSCGP